MIRLKHKIYPVWIEWEGEAETFKTAQTHVIEDIKLNGFKHWTAYEDITDVETKDQKYWHPENGKQVKKDTSTLHKSEVNAVQPEMTEGTPKQEEDAEHDRENPVDTRKKAKPDSLKSLKSGTSQVNRNKPKPASVQQ